MISHEILQILPLSFTKSVGFFCCQHEENWHQLRKTSQMQNLSRDGHGKLRKGN